MKLNITRGAFALALTTALLSGQVAAVITASDLKYFTPEQIKELKAKAFEDKAIEYIWESLQNTLKNNLEDQHRTAKAIECHCTKHNSLVSHLRFLKASETTIRKHMGYITEEGLTSTEYNERLCQEGYKTF
jgi:hypothetical protein